MKRNGMEREEQWIETLRQSLQRADEPLPEGGWEALERDLAAVGRRRRVFGPIWKKIAAAAAVVAIAVLIGETVIKGVVEGDRVPATVVGGLAMADGLLLYDNEVFSRRGEVPEAPAGASAAKAVRASDAGRSPKIAAEACPEQIVVAVAADGGPAVSGEAIFGEAVGEARSEQPALREETLAGQTPAASERMYARRTPAEPAARIFELPQPVRRTLVGLYAAGLPSAQHVSSGRATPIRSVAHVLSSSGIYRMKRGYDDYLYRHKQPLSFGISVGKAFGHGLSLESGLVYSLLRSDVRVSQEDDAFAQTLHMLGIPLRVNWDFLARADWKLYLGAGGMAEKTLYAKFGGERVAEKRLQWSLNAAAGVQYDFTSRTALYFEPGVSCYLTQTDLRTARTSSPVNLSLQVGVRMTY